MPPDNNPSSFDARKTIENLGNPRPPRDPNDITMGLPTNAEMERRERQRAAAARGDKINTYNTTNYVPARILWPALGFPAVVSPGAGESMAATRTLCALVLSNRDPARNPLAKADVARHLRLVPWAERRQRSSPTKERGGGFAFAEEHIEVRHKEQFLDDGRAQLVNLGDDVDGNNGLVVGLSTWVRGFYASKLPAKEQLKYLYEIRILEPGIADRQAGLYQMLWVNESKNAKESERSAEMATLLEHFARQSRFGSDGVRPLDQFTGKTKAAYEQKYIREYEYEFRQPEDAAHRTEALHPVFIGPPAARLTVGHLTDLHMDIRIDALAQRLQQSGEKMHNWNQACREVYDAAKGACNVLLMTGDLIDYGRGYSDDGPMNSEKSYLRDRNWFNFYTFLASGANYAKPVYTSLGNHDWRINPYPVLNESAPSSSEYGADGSAIARAHGSDARAKTYSTDPGMVLEGAGRLFFDRDGTFEVSRTALVTDVASVAWYLLLINPFLDYACRLPGGYNLLMLDWAEQELVDPENIMRGKEAGRGLAPDNFGGPYAKNCLTKVQKALVERVAGRSGAKIIGIHQPPVGPHAHWTDDELKLGRVRYNENDLRAAWEFEHPARPRGEAFQGTSKERSDGLSRMRGADVNGATMFDVAEAGKPFPGGEYPTLAIRTSPDEPLGREADCGSLVQERHWLIATLRQSQFHLVLSGHIHRRHVLVIDDVGKDLPPAWRGKWVVRNVPSGKPPLAPGPLYVNSTSAGPLGHIYPSRGRYQSAESAYTFVSIAPSGAIDAVEFRPETIRAALSA